MQGGARAIQPVADSFGEHLLPCGGEQPVGAARREPAVLAMRRDDLRSQVRFNQFAQFGRKIWPADALRVVDHHGLDHAMALGHLPKMFWRACGQLGDD